MLQIVSFGYTPSESLLHGTPGGAIEVVALIASGWLGDRLGHRILVSMVGLTIALLGMILIVSLPLENKVGRLVGYYLTQASPTPFVALLSLISTNIAGYTKKTTVAAMYLIGYCVGNIIGEQICLCNLHSCAYHGLKRTTNFPTIRRSSLRSGRNNNHRMLGRLFSRPSLHPLVE
jgi:MFS family permease